MLKVKHNTIESASSSVCHYYYSIQSSALVKFYHASVCQYTSQCLSVPTQLSQAVAAVNTRSIVYESYS